MKYCCVFDTFQVMKIGIFLEMKYSVIFVLIQKINPYQEIPFNEVHILFNFFECDYIIITKGIFLQTF